MFIAPLRNISNSNYKAGLIDEFCGRGYRSHIRHYKPEKQNQKHMQINQNGKGQGNGGGWPSTTGNPSGKGRSSGSK
ncbi:MAG TPA: hypothetical protein VFV23_10765 [Verrucomicrobiae bacterium]|nr:hypothetical protein [Verrucomicrobiae bacterium]